MLVEVRTKKHLADSFILRIGGIFLISYLFLYHQRRKTKPDGVAINLRLRPVQLKNLDLWGLFKKTNTSKQV